MSNGIVWHCLYVAPKEEFLCERELRRMGFEAFVPVERKYITRRSITGRRLPPKIKTYPMLLRYTFVGFKDGVVGWGSIIDHPRYFMRPVGMKSDRPYTFNADQIGAIASFASRSLPYATSVNPHKATLVVQPGDTARILDDNFYGHSGRVDSVTAGKAKVLINMFGSMRPITVALSKLEAA